MERLLSTIISHKQVDTLNTRFAKMEQNLTQQPLEQTLSFMDFGKYPINHADLIHIQILCIQVSHVVLEIVNKQKSKTTKDSLPTP
jgi:hypothetical protein